MESEANEEVDSKLKDAQSKLKLVKTHLRKSLGECESLRTQLAEATQNQQQLEAELLRQQTEQSQREHEQLSKQSQEIQTLRAQLAAATLKAQLQDKPPIESEAANVLTRQDSTLSRQESAQQAERQELQAYKERNNQYAALQLHVTRLEEKVSALTKEKIDIEKEKTAMVDKYCDLSTELEEQVARYKGALIKSTQEVRSLHEENERLLVKCESLTNFVKEQIHVESQKDATAVSLHLPSDSAARIEQLTAELQQVRKELKVAQEKFSETSLAPPQQKPRSGSESSIASLHASSSHANTSSSSNTPASSWGIFSIFGPKPTASTTTSTIATSTTLTTTAATTTPVTTNTTTTTSNTTTQIDTTTTTTTTTTITIPPSLEDTATTTTTTTTLSIEAPTTASTETTASTDTTTLSTTTTTTNESITPAESSHVATTSPDTQAPALSTNTSTNFSSPNTLASPSSTLLSSPISSSFASPSRFSSPASPFPSFSIPDNVTSEADGTEKPAPTAAQIRELEQQLGSVRHQLALREKQLADFLNTLSSVKQQKNALFSDTQALQAKNHSLTKDLEAAETKREEERRSRLSAETAAGELRLDVERLYSTNSQLTRANSTLQTELEGARVKIAAAATHEADLMAQCKLLEHEHAVEDGQAREALQLELDTLHKAQSEWTTAQREISSSLESVTAQYEDVLERLKEREQQLTRAEGELVGCQHKLAISEGERSQLERELESARAQIRNAEEQIKLLQAANQALDRKCQDASALKATETVNLAQLEALRTELAETKKALAQATQLKNEAEKERSLLQNEIARMHQELEEAQEEVKSMAKGITQMCETEYKLRSRLSDLDPDYNAEDINDIPLPDQNGFPSSSPLPILSKSTNSPSQNSLSSQSSYNFSSLSSRAGPANVSAGAAGLQGALACGCRAVATEAEAKGEVIFSGMMEKRPFKFSLSSGWRPRLFFLYANRLEYYSVDPRTKVCTYRGDIPFIAPIVLKRGRFENTYGLEISHPEGTFPLRCQSQASAVVWYEALVEVLKVKNTSGSFSFKSQASRLSVGSASRPLFGASLLDAFDMNDKGAQPGASEFETAVRARATSLGLPLIVSHCIDYLRREGLNVEGLFRVPGNALAVQALREQYEQGQVATLTSVNDVAAVLKQYLSSLPSSLIPFALAQGLLDAVKAVRDAQADERSEYAGIREVLNKLPEINLRVLRHLLGLLHQVSENANVNFMNANNCATVFAPTLLREEEPASNAPGAGARMLNFMSATTSCVRILITRYPLIFHRAHASTPSSSGTIPSPLSSPSSRSNVVRPAVSSISEQQDPSASGWSALPSLSTTDTK